MTGVQTCALPICEVQSALSKPVVRGLVSLIRFRNSHPAFGGQLAVESSANSQLTLTWRNEGDWAQLVADLAKPAATVKYSAPEGERQFVVGTAEN